MAYPPEPGRGSQAADLPPLSRCTVTAPSRDQRLQAAAGQHLGPSGWSSWTWAISQGLSLQPGLCERLEPQFLPLGALPARAPSSVAGRCACGGPGGQPALPEKDPWVGHPQQAGSRPVSGCGAATRQPGLGKEGPGGHAGVGSSRVGGGVNIQKGRGRSERECCCFIAYSPIISQRLRSWGTRRLRGGGRHSVLGRLRGAPGWVPEPSRQGSAQGPSGGWNEGSSHVMSLTYVPQPPVSKLGGRGLRRGAWIWDPRPSLPSPPAHCAYQLLRLSGGADPQGEPAQCSGSPGQ